MSDLAISDDQLILSRAQLRFIVAATQLSTLRVVKRIIHESNNIELLESAINHTIKRLRSEEGLSE